MCIVSFLAYLGSFINPYMSIYALFQVIGEIILMELKMHRPRIYRSTDAIHPKFVVRVSCMHTTHLDAVLLIYKASSRLQRHFCMWHVASTNQNHHVHFCGLVVSLWQDMTQIENICTLGIWVVWVLWWLYGGHMLIFFSSIFRYSNIFFALHF